VIRSGERRAADRAARAARAAVRFGRTLRVPSPRERRRDGSGSVLAFFQAWLRDPRRVAAVLPSGASLARAMTASIAPANAPVIELGPGTGVFTRALLERGVPEHRIALVELGDEFAQALGDRFPRATVVHHDASRLGGLQFFDGELAGAVVSGLPLLTMHPARVRRVLHDAFVRLRPDGAFYQFTYGLRCPVPARLLERLGLKATRVGVALRNLPPAAVYRIERR
jgi:phospholipid N-methyltransferase